MSAASRQESEITVPDRGRAKKSIRVARTQRRSAFALALIAFAAAVALIGYIPPGGEARAAPALQDPGTPTVTSTFTLTPSATPIPLLDTTNAERLYCGGVYSGDNATGANNVSKYGCVPWWDESGNEKVYRLELAVSQPVTVTLLSAVADMDLFLLRYVYPESCLAAGDTNLAYAADPGVYYLSVDGYRGATGAFSFRVDCPLEAPATPTPTFTPSPTPSATPTIPVTPTSTSTRIVTDMIPLYLPLVVRGSQGSTGPSVTLTLQDGLYGYSGTTDTTLDSWLVGPQGGEKQLKLFYGRPPKLTTQKSPVVRFDLSLLPPGAQVDSAILRLYMPAAPEKDLRVRAHGLLRPWEETSATWQVASTGQPWAEPGASAEGSDRTEWASAPQHLVEGEQWYELDVTAMAQEWARRPNSNYGVILTALAGDDDANGEAKFASREVNGSTRPQFVISYSLPASSRP